MKYLQTVTAIAVHPEGENPIFGESLTTVSLNDEAGGCFIVLKQESGEVRIDPAEFEEISKAVKRLLEQRAVN